MSQIGGGELYQVETPMPINYRHFAPAVAGSPRNSGYSSRPSSMHIPSPAASPRNRLSMGMESPAPNWWAGAPTPGSVARRDSMSHANGVAPPPPVWSLEGTASPPASPTRRGSIRTEQWRRASQVETSASAFAVTGAANRRMRANAARRNSVNQVTAGAGDAPFALTSAAKKRIQEGGN
jgi:hypothetical protein